MRRRCEAPRFQAPGEEAAFARAEEAAGTASVREAAGHRSLKESAALPCFSVASGRVTTFRLGGCWGLVVLGLVFLREGGWVEEGRRFWSILAGSPGGGSTCPASAPAL